MTCREIYNRNYDMEATTNVAGARIEPGSPLNDMNLQNNATTVFLGLRACEKCSSGGILEDLANTLTGPS